MQRYEDIEVPGQYSTLKDIVPDNLQKIDRFGHHVAKARKYGASYRRLAIISTEGNPSHFLIQSPTSRQSRREERAYHVFNLAEDVLQNKIFTRRHSCHFPPTTIIPFSSSTRLICDDFKEITLWEIMEPFQDPDELALHFRDSIKNGLVDAEIPLRRGVPASIPWLTRTSTCSIFGWTSLRRFASSDFRAAAF